eukprot:11373945-Karenia_brevis.AAC.1
MTIKCSPAFALENPDVSVPIRILHTKPLHRSTKPFINLRFKATNRMTMQYLEQMPHAITGFFHLLSYFRVASSGDCAGLTWLELFFLSVALSPTPTVDFFTQRAQSKRTIAQLLREFTTAALQFTRFLLPTHYQALFHSSFAHPNRLLSYGFRNRLTHTSIFVNVPIDIANALDSLIVQTFHGISRTQKEQYDNGQLHLGTRKIMGHQSMKHLGPLQNL